jgi:Tetrapyrrole (Corrin/Porphyrin) Methylases
VPGSLVIVGTGIALYGQTTHDARSCIERAGKVLYLVADPLTGLWITEIQPDAESLYPFYHPDKDRLTTYLEMTGRILACVRQGMDVCAVFYGHPGVFVYPSHEAIIQARSEGFPARMLPAVSAEDCLFADLGVDPGRVGCQAFEATDFLVHKRRFDPTSALVLWQIGVIGRIGFKETYDPRGIEILSEVLEEYYDPQHETVIYEAAQYPVCNPVMERVPLSQLAKATVSPVSTLYVPPRARPTVDAEMLARLGIPASYVRRKNEDPSLYDPLHPQFVTSLRA